MSHPSTRLDELVHQRVRLGILALLDPVPKADFAYLLETLKVTKGNLSAHLRVLEDAGLVAIQKTFEGRRTRTWIRATPAGRRSIANEMQTLEKLVDDYQQKR